ncbi:hypothetical protein DLAC_06799 [Tieghemostelium lacteum]|uniref:Uncharacterized protein n=1 Tax=Tieghemostelium lacteum TaxID=361077 RepID=A0A151ZDH6_TIELA|nr:hypothetical protein DLAC_06799 [Tieghemostelium lacteum]|eukprot:KYQ91979.1 hypothetical protein DLAC_06799 [Tieghemostelium lacteum]
MAHIQTSSVTVTHNLSHSGVLIHDKEDQAITTGVLLAIWFHRHPQATVEEVSQIRGIIGPTISQMIDNYLKTFQPKEALSQGAINARLAMYKQWGMKTLSRWVMLKDFILYSPLVVVLSDDECRSSDGLVTMVHKVTIERNDKKLSIMVGQKYDALLARMTSTSFYIMAVSMQQFNNLMYIINKPSLPPPSSTSNNDSGCKLM